MLTLEISKTASAETPLQINWGGEWVDVTKVSGDQFEFPAGPARVEVRYLYPGGFAGRISWNLDGSEVVCRPRALAVYGSYRAAARIGGGEPLELDATLRGCSTIVVRDQTAIVATLRNRLRSVSEAKIRTRRPVPAALLLGVFVFLLVDPHPYVTSG